VTLWCKAAVVCAAGALSCAPAARVSVGPPAAVRRPVGLPLTRAERSGYTETSRYADVTSFLDSLRALGAPLVFGVLGRTAQGREIPYVLASRPLLRTAAEARRLGRPIVYVQGNIHAGEVEGKEALQMLLRDLVFEQHRNVLDSIVLIAVPIYNIDGNEAVGPQERNRPEQNGPAIVGGRASANELNLNRDYMKAEAPETRASLAMFNAWDPDVFVDLHTTNGSLHGYALTYSPPLNPAAPLAEYTRGWLSVLRQRMRDRHRFETFDYGNFGTDDTPWQDRLVYSPRVHAWSSFDSRPRFSTNYYGLRGGVAILSEGYSHDPFERRVASTCAFVREILSLAAERSVELQARRRGAAEMTDRRSDGQPDLLPIRARFTTAPDSAPVLVEEIEQLRDTVRTEPGLPKGIRRTGRFRLVTMPIYDRFEPTLRTALPEGYVVPAGLRSVVALLQAHGIRLERVGRREWNAGAGAAAATRVREFIVDSVHQSARPFEGHREIRVDGSWRAATRAPGADDYFVPLAQPLGLLAAYLLKPRSDDGLVNWNFLDPEITAGRPLPILGISPVSSRR